MISAALAVLESEEQRNELSEFYEENKSRLYSIAFEHLHNQQDSEDAIQETFLRIADKPENFFKIAFQNRLAYANIIARNVAVDMFIKRNKISTVQLEDVEIDTIPLENYLFDKISRDEVVEFINRLPTAQRNVLMLRCFFGLSIDETSQRLNISLTTANKHLSLARKSIRKFIEERNR